MRAHVPAVLRQPVNAAIVAGSLVALSRLLPGERRQGGYAPAPTGPDLR